MLCPSRPDGRNRHHVNGPHPIGPHGENAALQAATPRHRPLQSRCVIRMCPVSALGQERPFRPGRLYVCFAPIAVSQRFIIPNENGGTKAAVSSSMWLLSLCDFLLAAAHGNRAGQTGAEQRQGQRLGNIDRRQYEIVEGRRRAGAAC